MKIHSVELRHVRQIRELSLDMSAPLTIVGGPNGVGKTTLQQAILAAMFFTEKKLRDSFQSEFDPDSPPTAMLGLSHGDEVATITLTRCLTDDKGEWCEGGTVLKRKKLALDKIQEVLPISADAAALLLWGRQDDMPRVVEAFPSEGHTLLTAASIKGSGPDPKDIIAELDKEIDEARKGERGGQVVGALIQASKRLEVLEAELLRAKVADEEVRNRKKALEQATIERDQLTQKAHDSEDLVKQLEMLDRLLASALTDDASHRRLIQQQDTWNELEKEIDRARQSTSVIETELGLLQSQYRVARDAELQIEIDKVSNQIKLGENLEAECAVLDKDLVSSKRPDPADIRVLERLQGQTREAQAKINATGMRYEITARKPHAVRLSEDGKTPEELTLTAGQEYGGVVGRLEFEIDGLRFIAVGKEDVALLKGAIEKSAQEIHNLFTTFSVSNEDALRALATEKQQLRNTIAEKRQELHRNLGASSLADLRKQQDRLKDERHGNNISLQDQDAWAGKSLPRAGDLMVLCSSKKGSLETCRANLANLEKKRPRAEETAMHARELATARVKAAASAGAFTAADPQQRAAGNELAEMLRFQLAKARGEKGRLDTAVLTAATTVANLSGQLKQTQAHRSLEDIQSDLEEAKDTFNREKLLQDARALVKERIEEKIEALGSMVPVDLAKRVTQQLERLSGGPFHEVVLEQGLTVSHVAERSAHKDWQPHQLSHGERHQTALAVKIAVARALAETSGPIFIVLDDSLVAFDPERRAASEELLLEQVADEKLQVIILTCHTDWAADWKARCPEQVNYIELARSARYYREPPAVLRAAKRCR